MGEIKTERNPKEKKIVPLWSVVLISILVGLLIVVLFLYRPENDALKNYCIFLNAIENKCEKILNGEYASTFAAQGVAYAMADTMSEMYATAQAPDLAMPGWNQTVVRES